MYEYKENQGQTIGKSTQIKPYIKQKKQKESKRESTKSPPIIKESSQSRSRERRSTKLRL